MFVALFPFVIACFLVCLLLLMVVDNRHFRKLHLATCHHHLVSAERSFVFPSFETG
jgi:hypothetical protein